MSCSLAQEMWTKMETGYLESADDIASLLWSQFYGCKCLPGQTIMEFISEIEHIVSRLRAIDGIVLLDNQITAKIILSLPPSLKLIFKAAWESTAAAEKTLRNLTTRLVQMEKEVKQCEEEKTAEALLSSKKIDSAQPSTSEIGRDYKEGEGKNARACWECGDSSHIRANCRDYKRKLKRRRDEEEDDRDRKKRRWDRDNDDRTRQDKDDNQWRNRREREDHDRGGRDYGNNNYERGRRDQKDRKREDNGGRRGYSYSAATTDSRSTKPTEWFADSGATQHMTGNRDLLVNFVPTGSECWMVNGIGESKLAVAGQGDVNVVANANGKTVEGVMRGVLFVPGLGINLYSIGSATDAGIEVHFANNTVVFSHKKVIIMEGKRSGKEALYHLNIKAEQYHPRTEQALKGARVEPLSIWHQRFGHLNNKSLLKMASMGSVKGLALFKDQLHPSGHCRGCLQGKMSRAPFQSTRTKTTNVGQVIHSDVCGPMQVATQVGERYFVVFKDDFSGWIEIKLLKNKSEVPNTFKKFSAKLEAETGEKAMIYFLVYRIPLLIILFLYQQVKILRSDGGGEYSGIEFKDWLARAGITQQVTPPYTPQLNGVAERANRTIVETARSQMYGRKVPLELWGLAMQCAAYVKNRTVSSVSNVTPFELWFKKRPDISHLKVFGCLVFLHVPDEKRKKLDPKAVEAMMVGYVEGSASCYQVCFACTGHVAPMLEPSLFF